MNRCFFNIPGNTLRGNAAHLVFKEFFFENVHKNEGHKPCYKATLINHTVPSCIRNDDMAELIYEVKTIKMNQVSINIYYKCSSATNTLLILTSYPQIQNKTTRISGVAKTCEI